MKIKGTSVSDEAVECLGVIIFVCLCTAFILAIALITL